MPDDAEEGLSGVLSGKTDHCFLSNLQLLDDSTFDLSELDSEGRVIITYHLIKYVNSEKYCFTKMSILFSKLSSKFKL